MAGALAAFDEASQELFLPLTTVQVPEAKTHMGGHGAHNGAAAPPHAGPKISCNNT